MTRKTRMAVERVNHYLDMREEKPVNQCDDTIHGVHIGTEWEAELLLSDLILVMQELEA